MTSAFLKSHLYKSNQSFWSSFATAAMLSLLHEIAGAKSKETNRGLFSNSAVSQSRADLLC